MKRTITIGLIAVAGVLTLATSTAQAQNEDARDARIANLEEIIQQLADEVQALKAEQATEKKERIAIQEEIAEQTSALEKSTHSKDAYDLGGFEVSGYGEIHANMNQGDDGDQIDIHRFVLDFKYDFSDWITFRSELEVEHAFISDDDGEISLEQFYVDFMLNDKLNVRAGRALAPIGIINQHHEPTLFNGVERPNVDKYIIPTTWSLDGLGIYGDLTKSLKYQLYIAGGLDGSKFSATKGIRDGRIKERPSLNDPAVAGRLDYYPFVNFPAAPGQTLRVGLSGYSGGANNGNEGNDPDGLSGVNVHMGVADFEYSIAKFDLRGEYARTWIDNAEKLSGGVGDEMLGWYIEPAYHVMPESWKTGRLKKSDLVLFTRYEEYDTQYSTVSGLSRVPGADREEVTVGMNFYFTPSLVFKADYQFTDSDATSTPDDRLNFGLGMQF